MRQKPNLDRPGLISGLLVLAALAAYLPVIYLGFLNYDDDLYVTANTTVQKGLTWEGTRWAFAHFHAANWHPLTWLSHMADVQLHGLRPMGHHVTNLLFHAANSVILFLWLRSLTGACGRSAFVAALFALHPLHVESVAWVAERKDLLSAFFGLLSLWAYTGYAKKSWRPYYFLSLFLFALGLLSKPMLVTWPCVMLLLDYWPLGRTPGSDNGKARSWGRLLAEKIPFFALSLASSVVTFLAQRAGAAVASLQALPPGTRLANALTGWVRYVGKILWPAKLAVIYPSSNQPEWGVAAGAALLLAGATWLAFRQRKRRPWLLVGWLWFLGTLVPVIGLVQVGNQSIADRYAYLPAIGLFIIFAWAAAELAGVSPRMHRAVIIAGAAALVVFAALTGSQLLYWQDSGTLFRRALAVTKNNFVAWNNLGFFLAEHRELREAETCYRNAVEINPSFEPAWYDLGCTLADLGRRDEAIAAFESALRINPGLAKAHNNLATTLAAAGNVSEAESHLRAALALDPRSAGAHGNLAALLAQEGKWEEAVAEFTRALELDPGLATAQTGLAGALAKQGHYDEAVSRLSELLQREPGNVSARLQLAGTLGLQGKLAQADETYLEIIRANPANATAQYRLAALLMRQGKTADAIQYYRAAIEARPNHPEALNNLAWILATNPDAQFRNGPEAVRLAELACQATGYRQAYAIGTLAAAYAEAGRFPEAIATAQKAEALAKSANDPELAATTARLLESYRAGKPYRDTAP